jgi:hypothetical protein
MPRAEALEVGNVYDVTVYSEGRTATFRGRYVGPVMVDAHLFSQGDEAKPAINWNWPKTCLSTEIQNVVEVTHLG